MGWGCGGLGTSPPQRDSGGEQIERAGPTRDSSPMKRMFAVVALLAALGVLLKLALKENPTRPGERAVGPPAAGVAAADPEGELLARYPKPDDRALVERVLSRYRQTALAVE